MFMNNIKWYKNIFIVQLYNFQAIDITSLNNFLKEYNLTLASIILESYNNTSLNDRLLYYNNLSADNKILALYYTIKSLPPILWV